MSAEVKSGYKQTEAGLIPEDWEARPLLSVVRLANGQVDPTVEPYKSMPLIAPDHIESGTGTLLKIQTAEEQGAISGKYFFSSGDIIYSKIRPYLKKVVHVDFDGLCSADMYPMTPLTGISANFVLPVLLGHRFSSYAETVSVRSGMPKINREELACFSIPLPPAEEQVRIGITLSDTDALISSLDQLIAKKRDIRQATMQQLLTGQRRLPGFSGEWVTTRFSEIVKHHSGNSTLIKGKLSSEQIHGYFPAYSASGQDVWCQTYEHEGQAIIVSAVGSRCGKAFKADGKWSAIANTHIVWPAAGKVTINFLSLFLNDENFWLKSGSGQPFVLFKQSFSRPLSLPSLEEQSAIAHTLEDIASEIERLNFKREKLCAIKTGMAQSLLTGKIRLISEA